MVEWSEMILLRCAAATETELRREEERERSAGCNFGSGAKSSPGQQGRQRAGWTDDSGARSRGTEWLIHRAGRRGGRARSRER